MSKAPTASRMRWRSELVVTGHLHAALPACGRLKGQESDRVMRYLAKLSRY